MFPSFLCPFQSPFFQGCENIRFGSIENGDACKVGRNFGSYGFTTWKGIFIIIVSSSDEIVHGFPSSGGVAFIVIKGPVMIM